MLGAPRIEMRGDIASNLQSTVRDLQRRKARGRRGLAVLEGVRLVVEGLAAGLEFKGALVSPDLARTTRAEALTAEQGSPALGVVEVWSRPVRVFTSTVTTPGTLA